MDKNFIKKIIGYVEYKIEKILGIFIFTAQVKNIKYVDEKINIEAINLENGFPINIKQVLGTGIGNAKGIVNYPSEGDQILILNLFGYKIMLGSIYDIGNTQPDNQLLVENDEMLLVAKTNGSYIRFFNDNTIKVVGRNGAKLKIGGNGEFKLFDKNNYGIESDGSGNITIRRESVNHTQTPGEFK